MAAIALLLKRALSFIIRTINLFRKFHRTNDPDIKEKLKTSFHPKIYPVPHPAGIITPILRQIICH